MLALILKFQRRRGAFFQDVEYVPAILKKEEKSADDLPIKARSHSFEAAQNYGTNYILPP